MQNEPRNGELITVSSTPGPMAAAIQAEITGIKNAGRLSWQMNQLFHIGDKHINELGAYADPSILTMLNLPFKYGDMRVALKAPQSVVISETMAGKFFGEENPVGKTLKAESKQPNSVDGIFLVTGVFKDFPKNCSYNFQWFSPYEIHQNKIPAFKQWIPLRICETLVELEPSVSPGVINKKLKNFLKTKIEGSSIECFLFSMNDWNLRNHFTDGKQDSGNIKYVKLFSLLALMILLIACINFMNLATARSEQRAKEVGVRKVLGSGKVKLIWQFIGESMLMSFMAVVVAICLIYLLLPSYNLLIQKSLSPSILRPLYLGELVIIGLLCGLIAGSYPAFYLSSFNPVIVLKGLKLKTSTASIFIRKALVTIQFAVSVILIFCTVIIYQQVHYIKNRDLGFRKDRMIYFPLQANMKNNFSAIREEFINSNVIENAALTQSEPLHIYRLSDNYEWQGKAPGNKVSIYSNSVSPEYISTMHMRLLSGRDFYSTPNTDSNAIIINESMAKLMAEEGKPGSIVTRDSLSWTVVGIVKDFVFNDMYSSATPMLLRCHPRSTEVMVIAFRDGIDLGIALKKTEKIIKANNRDIAFHYYFVDEQFSQQFVTETLIEKLAGVFALLAIFISCLGLLGLAAYTAERRTKEIGIRKVLGASVSEMASLLSKDFLKLVLISTVIAFPVAWWAMNNWLQNYEYRTPIYWWVFGIAGISAILIALLTVSYQAIKAALSNPIKSLRTQ